MDALPNLSDTTPSKFVQEMKAAYINGSGKAAVKFQALRKQVTELLEASPPPGPAVFTVQCLESLLAMESPYREGLSHLVMASFKDLDEALKAPEDMALSQRLAAHLFTDALSGKMNLETPLLLRLVIVFKLQLKDIAEAYDLACDEAEKLDDAKTLVETFVLSLIKAQSYKNVVILLKHFDLRESIPQDFMMELINHGHPVLAGQWAAHLGQKVSCSLIQQCTEMGWYKVAYKLVERYQLHDEFPDAYYLYKHRSLKKLIKKGSWEKAEAIAAGDPILHECVVKLALHKGDSIRAADISQRLHLKASEILPDVPEDKNTSCQFVQLSSIIPLERVIWIDTAGGLELVKQNTTQIDQLAFDCEWKADHVKGSKPSKVAVLQLATEEYVFVLDLLKLFQQNRKELDDCITVIFHSPNISKLGFSAYNDLERLSESYPDLKCFHECKPILDLQKVSGIGRKGGLSGLAKVSLGHNLDKSMRMSDWEKRPLSVNQLHYAALDAAVLLPIYKSLTYSRSASNQNIVHPECWKAETTSTSKKKHANMLKSLSALRLLAAEHEYNGQVTHNAETTHMHVQ
ncbi:hypothetical protein O6H91_12G086000 [Diphasiastrum complanatum]|uniref:Uncharacterized protein n=2 Tax=Diphasiastrum complanatum TaxID=34168 RepID=A0ACC2C4G8_DIPCM|nr:hypothetical protein O6H91_12G086000 [Diphasiastrum complanatum]